MSQSPAVIILTFSETVDVSSVNLADAVIQSYPQRKYGNFVRTSSSKFEIGAPSESSIIFVTLDEQICNQMKFQKIGQTASSSLLSWGKVFLRDMASNLILPIYDASIPGVRNQPVMPDIFVPDRQPPVLEKWIFDFEESRSMFLYFSEPVEVMRVTSIGFIRGSSVSDVWYISELSTINYSKTFLPVIHILNLETGLQRMLTKCDDCYIIIGNQTIRDYASPPNYMIEVSASDQHAGGSPVCDDACPGGFYQSSACTKTDDRICSPCSSCKADEFELGSCSRYQDTQCKICSTCKYGTYVSDKCSTTTDTVCSLCTSCSSLEFEMSECTEGRDTICGTCEQCTFASKMTEIECRRELYYVWHDSNCCFDSEGKKLASCSYKDYEDIRIRARNARHHWAVPVSDPLIDDPQYAFGQKF